jgi:hypothetical protein
MYLTIIILIEKEVIQDKIEEVGKGLLICGANVSFPVMDAAYYIDQLHYKIGNKLYIENAD